MNKEPFHIDGQTFYSLAFPIPEGSKVWALINGKPEERIYTRVHNHGHILQFEADKRFGTHFYDGLLFETEAEWIELLVRTAQDSVEHHQKKLKDLHIRLDQLKKRD